MENLHRTLHAATWRTRVAVWADDTATTPPLLYVRSCIAPTANRCHTLLWTLYATHRRRRYRVKCFDEPSMAAAIIVAIDDALDALNYALMADADVDGPFDIVTTAARLHAALLRIAPLHDVRMKYRSRELSHGCHIAEHHRVVEWVARVAMSKDGAGVSVDVIPRSADHKGWGPYVGHHLCRIIKGQA